MHSLQKCKCMHFKKSLFLKKARHLLRRSLCTSTNLAYEPYTFHLITNFSSSSINPLLWIHFVSSIVAYGHSINNAIYINMFAINVITFEIVIAKMFHVIWQHYFNIGIVRIPPPRFFESSHVGNWLPQYPKRMPITMSHGMHPPNPSWTLACSRQNVISIFNSIGTSWLSACLQTCHSKHKL